MPLNDVNFLTADGNLGGTTQGVDDFVGLVAYIASVPSGLSADPINVLYSVKDAEDLGLSTTAAEHRAIVYHVREFFRLAPGGKLALGVYAKPSGANTFAEVVTLQSAVEGKCRFIGVYTPGDTFTAGDDTALNGRMVEIAALQMPAHAFYTPDIVAFTDLFDEEDGLPDLSEQALPHVTVCIGQDGAGEGNAIARSTMPTKLTHVGCVGALLGQAASTNVGNSFAYVERGNVATTELDVIAFANGTKYSTVAKGQLDALQDMRYVFLRKYIGVDGSYFNDSINTNLVTSDYNSVERMDAINKLQRRLYPRYVRQINSAIRLENGKLSTTRVSYLQALGQMEIDNMARLGQVSTGTVYIDPTQDLLASPHLEVRATLVPLGMAKSITIVMAFSKQ